MTAIPATTNEAPRKTHLDYRAATKPGWVFAITGLVSPSIGLSVYAFKQRSWAYVQIWLALFATLFTVALASPEGDVNRGVKIALQLAAGGAAAKVAANHKKNARKELGLND